VLLTQSRAGPIFGGQAVAIEVALLQRDPETHEQLNVNTDTGTSIASLLATAAAIWVSVTRCWFAASLLVKSTRTGSQSEVEVGAAGKVADVVVSQHPEPHRRPPRLRPQLPQQQHRLPAHRRRRALFPNLSA
jgi:hypothetical protein